ncbi:MAG: 2-hydroxyacid dehydrogenase [Azospirillaceae bacterium]
MTKVLFRYDCAPWLEDRLAGLASEGVEVATCGEADDDAYPRLMAEAEVLWHVLRPVTAEAIAAAPRLRLIQKIGVGVNTIDLDAAKSRGIAVCNMPGTNTAAVAELALGAMLACLRRIVAFDGAVRAGRGWAWPLDWQGGLGEIGGRTVGLVGFGAVPRRLAPVLEALGAEVIFWNRTPRPEAGFAQVDKAELLARADIVSMHLPLTPETADWLDAEAIAALRPGAVVVNVARGGLVDEAALVAALESGHVAAAGLDVFAREPVAPDDPLLARDEVVLTPHVGWLTRETLERSLAVALDNVRRLETGRDLRHGVA